MGTGQKQVTTAVTESIKILHLSDSPFLNTGFSSQSLFLMNGLADRGYDIHYMGHNYHGQDIPKDHIKLSDETPFKFSLSGTYREPYCIDTWQLKLRQIKPDYQMTLLDTFMLFPHYLQFDFAPAKTVFWFPTDGGGGLPNGCDAILRKCAIPVAMSRFGQRQVKDYYNLNVHHIPHAVDEKLFFPISNEKRRKLRNAWGIPVDKFIVGVVGRNQGRKSMDRVFKSFVVFRNLYPEIDATLLMHTDPLDTAAAFNLQVLVNRYHLQNRCMFTGVTFANGFPYIKMNEVYNLFDVYFSTTTGEGFGICSVEAMACSVPVIITDYTTSPEFIMEGGQCGELVPLVGLEQITTHELMQERGYNQKQIDDFLLNGTLTGSWEVERGIMDVIAAAKAMKKMYDHPELREQYGKIGREKVLKNYTWKNVINQWDELLRKRL